MKKFTENDVLINTIKVYPKIKLAINNGNVYYNDTNGGVIELSDFLQPPSP